MFKRRVPKSLIKKLIDFMWPSIGWGRSLKYTKHRVIRLSDTTHNVAGGLAIGTCVSFTPIVGTHFLQAALVSYLTRMNVMSAIIGTFIGNPWTFPFIWWASMTFGSFLFGLFGLPADVALPHHVSFSILWNLLLHQPMRIFLPWLVGGYTLAVLVWFPSYLVFYYLVKGAKVAKTKAHIRRLQKRAHKVAKEVTGQKK